MKLLIHKLNYINSDGEMFNIRIPINISFKKYEVSVLCRGKRKINT